MKFDLLKNPLHFYKDRSEAPQWLIDANEKLIVADAFLIITPEYNSTIPPALSNMLDHFPPSSYAYRPTGIVNYSVGQYSYRHCYLLCRLVFLQTLFTTL